MPDVWGQIKAQSKSVWGTIQVNVTTKWGFPKIDISIAKGLPSIQTKSVWGLPLVCVNNSTPVDPSSDDTDDEDPLPPDFPGGDVIDDFNRAENPLSTGWARTSSSWEQLIADGAKAIPGLLGGFSSSYRNGTPKLNNDSYYTIVTASDEAVSAAGIWLRLQPGTLGGNQLNIQGYLVYYQWPSIMIYRKLAGVDFGVPESLVASVGAFLWDTNKLGARISGTNPVNIKVYTDTGTGWVEVLSFDDTDTSRVKTKGNAGVHIYQDADETVAFTIDNFGGM